MSDTRLPAIVHFGTVDRARAILGIASTATLKVSLAPDGASLRLPLGPIERLEEPAPRKRKGASSEQIIPASVGTEVGEGETVFLRIPPVDYRATRYRFVVSPNPALLRLGHISGPGIVSKTELENVLFSFTAHKKVDLADLYWVFDVAAID